MSGKQYRAGLYMRLSKEDGEGESSSIGTQRSILRAFAEENGFAVYNEYADDGWSGTNFDRPAFKRMISDIENGRINLVITKDLSRLGRDYIAAGQYTEIYFPSKGVRFIAVNDGYDSESPYSDIAPFRNVINEMYARDTSRKIRSAFIAKMNAGKYIGNFAPYGYKKDPSDRNRLIIDPEPAAIVRRIFSLSQSGKKPSQIAAVLNGEKIAPPSEYRVTGNVYGFQETGKWTAGTVSKMLGNITYIGDTAQGKTTKVSFKSKSVVRNPRREWIVAENTHDPVVSRNVFDDVRRISQSRTCGMRGEFSNVFSGLAKCADCGKNMSSVGTRRKGGTADLACGGYKLGGAEKCTNHFTDYDALYETVACLLRENVRLSEREKQKIVKELEQSERDDDSKTCEERTAKKRLEQIDGIIGKLYEDNFSGLISDERFRKLLVSYESEADRLREVLGRLSEENRGDDNSGKYAALVDKFLRFENLTPELLFTFIDRIEVEQGHYEKTENGRVKRQKLRIFFNFSGKDREIEL